MAADPTASTCPDCGWFLSDCQCYEHPDDDGPCSHCGGEGDCACGMDPLWYDEIHPCHACNGTGNARDQVIW